jgi:HAMP domain-containing protein
MNIPDDKMIVAVLVFSLILTGLALLLFYLERRLNKAEKKLEELKQNMENPYENAGSGG